MSGRIRSEWAIGGVALSAVFIALFLLVSRQIEGDTALTRFDTEVGKSLEANRQQMPVLRPVLWAITMLAAFQTLTILVPLGGLLFWLKKQRTVAVAFLVCGLGAGVLNHTLKKHFDRHRPEWKDEWVYESNQSFPSGHSSGSMAMFGMLGYLLARTGRTRRVRVLGGSAAALLILAIGFSRIYLGAHYFSDVIGGYLIGAAWLTLCITALECAQHWIQTSATGREPPVRGWRKGATPPARRN
jgi:membrane-associated phospholipid phosphatase